MCVCVCVCTVTRFFVRCCVVTEKQKKCTEFLFRHFNTSNGTKRHAGKRERERAHQTFTHSFCESRRRKKKKKKENSENLECKIEPSSSRYSVQFLLPDSIHTVFLGGFLSLVLLLVVERTTKFYS